MKKIIISQTKNIGDVVLLLPMLGLLKQYCPDTQLVLLALRYTQPVAQCFPYLHGFIDWTALEQKKDVQISQRLAAEQADVWIHVAVNKRLARLAQLAGIPRRIGTGQRYFHWYTCSDLVNQARRHSRLHETQLNIKLLAPLSIPTEYSLAQLLPFVRLHVPDEQDMALDYDSERFNLIVHPGSHGHGREWPVASFRALIQRLPQEQFKIFITGSRQEYDIFQTDLLHACPQAVNLMGRLSLSQLINAMAHCDGLLASGTGPLHVAAAVGIHALGLFPPRKGINPRRWAPLGARGQYLVYPRPRWQACLRCLESHGCHCMAKITVEQVAAVLQSWWQAKQANTAVVS